MAEFKQIKENLNALHVSSDAPIYDYAAYHDLVDIARKVRGLSVFSGYSTPVYSSLRPFHYQETAVQTMLIDFEGRGVFGDQVGLGKTIEALMTAHIMFRQREIRNMLVVCPPNLVDQWTSEISTKFRNVEGNCVFDIRLEKDNTKNWSLKNSVKKLKEQIKALGDAVTDRLPVFFLSTTSLTAPANMEEEEEIAGELRNIERKIQAAEEKLKQLQGERERVCDPMRMGLEEQDRFQRAKVRAKLTNKPIDEVYEGLREVKRQIAAQEKVVASLREKYDRRKQDSLWEMPVDLLVVDEADTVVSDAVSKKLAGKDVEKADLLLKSLTNLRKKYCILVSATPLRAQLEDIYYLVKIVDENRFTSLDSFYSYVGAKSLAELVQNEELLKRLTGLINTMFTRARMHDKHVAESYPPEADCTIFRVVTALRGNKQDAKIIWTHPGYPPLSDREIGKRLNALRTHVENSIRIFYETQGGGSEKKFDREDVERFFSLMRNDEDPDTLDTCTKIIMCGLRDYYLASQDVFIHRYIDWSRQKKNGRCYNICGDDDQQNRGILDSLGRSGTRGDRKVVIFEGKSDNRMVLYEQLRERFPDRKIFVDFNEPALWKRIGSDMTVSDQDDYEDDPYDADGDSSARSEGEQAKNYKAYKRWNVREFSRPDPEYADAIYLIDQTRREGTNLNCASRLIICQITTSRKGGLLDPLRFEQIIGRLNRVGQLDNIIIDVYVDNDRELALYNLYADEEGLDMVRLGKPEVSFIIPIVTELFRAKKNRDAKYRGLKKDADFVDIFNYCYDNREHGYLQELRNEIKKLCGILMAKNVQEDM